ncbi:hypothetical protein AGMMS49938_15680 [Fibrobacterales bacterium]|nr:hypothetical protein AGMMS49938_15680 [Fibrobacterales bacterium]
MSKQPNRNKINFSAQNRKMAREKEMKRLSESQARAQEQVKKMKKEQMTKERKEQIGRKSRLKRIGVKSLLAIEDSVAATKFGQGAEAIVEMKASADGSKFEILPKIFNAKVEPKEIEFAKKDNSVQIETQNPSNVKQIGEDYLGLKDYWEKKIFEKNYNDNIHIQIAYNILDIRKVFGLYINDIVFAINNLARGEEDEKIIEDSKDSEDAIGMLCGQWCNLEKNNKKEKYIKFLQKMEAYFGYFGSAFAIKPQKKKESKDNYNKRLSENFDVLRILSYIRQMTIHSNMQDFLFNLDSKNYRGYEVFTSDLRKKIEQNYKLRIDEINGDFTKNSYKNLSVIFDLLKTPEEKRKEICEEYYKFSIFKDGKNLGVNCRKLREVMFEDWFKEVKNKDHDSYRQKIYSIADFLIFNWLNNSGKIELDKMIEKLREVATEDKKEKLYKEFANNVWHALSSEIEQIPNRVKEIVQDKKENKFPIEWIWSVQGDAYISNNFSQLIAYICNFLEGKEINELLSALINKFENIKSLLNVLKDLGQKPEYSKEYKFFENIENITNELRLIHSVGKMKGDFGDAKRALFKDAAAMLGIVDFTSDYKDEYFDNLSKNKEQHPFRNFIANNLIESGRFQYIVRYGNPKNVRSLMQNKDLIKFVLSKNDKENGMPDTLIERYFGFLENREVKTLSKYEKIDRIADALVGVKFDTYKNDSLINKGKKSSQENLQLEKKKGLLGLYLTVAYLIIKSVVKINARYFIAFQCFDRDYAAFREQSDCSCHSREGGNLKGENLFAWSYNIDKKKELKGTPENYYAITEHLLSECGKRVEIEVPKEHEGDRKWFSEQLWKKLKERNDHFGKHEREYLRKNLDEMKQIDTNNNLCRLFRNNIVHLNTVTNIHKHISDFNAKNMTSYFDLFWFVLQKDIIEKASKTDLSKFNSGLNEHKTPNKDFIKLLCLPFAYNLARYKNLSIGDLFEK